MKDENITALNKLEFLLHEHEYIHEYTYVVFEIVTVSINNAF